MKPLFWLALMACTCQAQMTPLRAIASQPKATSISILGVRFQELKLGHEGPDYFSADHAPYRGKQAVVEVSLYGQDAIRSVQFELVDQFGMVLVTPVAIRVGSGADADEYLLLVDVPAQPFRFKIEGEDFRGQPYERVDKKLFTPVEGAAPPLQLPPGLPAGEAEAYQRMVENYRAETQARFDAARRASPDGVIRLPRSEVLEASYEPLRSPAGHEIGLRLHLAVRFGADGDYNITPNLYSQYKNSDLRQITLKVLDAQASPAPTNIAADTLDDVLRYGGAAHYTGGQVYHFQFDATPTYIIRNITKTRYCIYSEQFRASSHMATWEAVEASETPVRYHVDIPSLDFQADTGDLPPQRLYLESFRRDGAGDCGPTPTNRF